jgi:hypothetical protein
LGLGKEEARRKKEEGRRKKEEGRRKRETYSYTAFELYWFSRLQFSPFSTCGVSPSLVFPSLSFPEA